MSNPIRKIAAFTLPICRSICKKKPEEEKYGCCDALFCHLVKKDFPPGVSYPETGHPIPFMGPKGCTVKPEHRAFCSAFLCPGIKDIRPDLWKKYLRLCKKFGIVPVKPMR